MRMATLRLLAISLTLGACIGAQTAQAQITLLFDDFNGGGLGVGDATSVNGGFQIVSNDSNGTGSVAEIPSNATITTAANNFDNTGIVSINSIDASSLADITATWNITSQSGIGSGVFRGTELLLQGATSNGTGDGTGFRATPYIEFDIEDNGQWRLVADDGGGAVVLFDGGGLVSGVPDGYSVTLDLDEDGWAINSSGFGANPIESGLWSGGFDFSDLQTDLFAAAMIQTDSNSGAFLNVDSIHVTTTPEPASIAIWFVLGLGIVGVGYFRSCGKKS